MKDPKKLITTRPNGSKRVQTVGFGPTKTQQQFKDETDVNLIIKKYKKTGEFSHVSKKVGQYVDVSSVTDYLSMRQQVIDAENAFMELPSDIRKRFRNSPHELIVFLNNEQNYDEAVKLGLIDEKPAPIGSDEPNDVKKQAVVSPEVPVS